MVNKNYPVHLSPASYFLFVNKRISFLWLIVRSYLGYQWLSAGLHKVTSPAWVGENAGAAVEGFLKGALTKTGGEHPDVSTWYAYFIEHIALQHVEVFSYLVAFGEVFVGLGLLAGCLVGVSAFFGIVMNFNFLFAGTVSINPQMVLLGFLLILAWRNAGHIGLDRWILPYLQTKEFLLKQTKT